MKNKVNPGLKSTFWVHAFVAGLFGLFFLFIPEQFGDWVAWDMGDAAYRLIGAFCVALSVSSVLAAMAEEWIEVRIKVGLELVWTVLATMVMVWALLTEQIPTAAWMYVAIFTIFFIVFGYYGLIERREEERLLIAVE